MVQHRLPIVNSDDGTWGDILRWYLSKEHYNNDTDDATNNGGHQNITIRAGSTTAAPITFSSGTNLTSATAGAMEYDGSYYYLTTSSATRKKLAIYDDSSGANGDIYYRDGSGNFKRLAAGSPGNVLTIASGIPSWASSIVGTALTVKDGTNFIVQNTSDTTKQLKFDLSGLVTGHTTTLAVPDVNGTTTIVGTDAAQYLTNKTMTVPLYTSVNVASQTNMNLVMPGGSPSSYTALTPFGTIYHDNLRFGTLWGTPTFEQYNGSSWSSATLDKALFAGLENSLVQVFNGSGTTGARWTWNSANISFSYALDWLIGTQYQATPCAMSLLIESSANGTSWTTRHTSSATAGTPVVWLYQTDNAGDSYIRLTITTTNSQGLYLSSIKAMSSRAGAQGGGKEYESAYSWDKNANITIGTTTARSNGVLNIGSTSPTTAAQGIYFGTDTDLYRSAANTLKTDGGLIVGTPGTSSGSVSVVDGTQTLTNKTIQPRVVTVSNSATPAINTDNGDVFNISGIVQNITSMTTNLTGTPVDGQRIRLVMTANSNYTISWGSMFENGAATQLPATFYTSFSFRIDADFIYSSSRAKWHPAEAWIGLPTLVNPKVVGSGILDGNGAVALSINGIASAVNYMQMANSITGSSPTLSAQGSDTDVSLNFTPKGAGVIKANGVQVADISSTQTLSGKTLTAPKFVNTGYIADANGNAEIIFNTTASAVNQLTIANATTGNYATISASGTDTNVGINLRPKGGAGINLMDANSNIQFATAANPGSSAVNYLFANNANTGSPGILGAWGSDTNVSMNLTTKGTGTVQANGVQLSDISSVQTLTNKTLTSPKIGTSILDTNGNIILGLSPTASSVNYLTINNNITTRTPGIAAQGSDSVITIYLQSKGGGGAQVDGDNIITATATQTLTNKRVTPRVVSVSSSATPSINTDNGDHFNLTALAAAVTSMTTNLTGTPTDGQRIMIRIKDNGTARAITWGASFLSSGSAQLLATTSANMTHHNGFIWDAAKSAWVCIAVDAVGY